MLTFNFLMHNIFSYFDVTLYCAIWLHISTSDILMSNIVSYVDIWVHIAQYEFTWRHMNSRIYINIWYFNVQHCFICRHMSSHWATWIHMKTYELSRQLGMKMVLVIHSAFAALKQKLIKIKASLTLTVKILKSLWYK